MQCDLIVEIICFIDPHAVPYSCPNIKTESRDTYQDADPVQLHIPKFRPTNASCYSVKVKIEPNTTPQYDTNNLSKDCQFDRQSREDNTPSYVYSDPCGLYDEGGQSAETYKPSKAYGHTHLHINKNSAADRQFIRNTTDFNSDYPGNYPVNAQNIKCSEDQFWKNSSTFCPQFKENDFKKTGTYACSVAPAIYDDDTMNYSAIDYQQPNTYYDQAYTSQYMSSSCYHTAAEYSDMSLSVTQTTRDISFRATGWSADAPSFNTQPQFHHSSAGYRPYAKKCKLFLRSSSYAEVR